MTFKRYYLVALFGIVIAAVVNGEPNNPNNDVRNLRCHSLITIEWPVYKRLVIPKQLATMLTGRMCRAKGKICKDHDPVLENSKPLVKYAPTEVACVALCRRHLRCLNAYYDNNRKCHLQITKCNTGKMEVNSPGFINYRRLYVNQTCQKDEMLFAGPQTIYTPSYCQISKYYCPLIGSFREGKYNLDVNDSFYPEPWNFADTNKYPDPLLDCLRKCTRNQECRMLNYNHVTKRCFLIRKVCKKSDLRSHSDFSVYFRQFKAEFFPSPRAPRP